MSVKKYRIYCTDESAFVEGWSETIPTTCFNNNTHTIDTNQTAITDIQITDTVTLNQKNADANTQDSYYLFTREYTIEPFETKECIIDLDTDVNLFSVYVTTRSENKGDVWSSHINKNTVIGVSMTTTTGTGITLPTASMPYIKVGYFISLDGTTFIRILAKDTVNDTITLKESVSVTAGDPIMMTYFMIHEKIILDSGRSQLGGSIFGSSKIPKEYTTGITYKNNSSGVKRVIFELETTF